MQEQTRCARRTHRGREAVMSTWLLVDTTTPPTGRTGRGRRRTSDRGRERSEAGGRAKARRPVPPLDGGAPLRQGAGAVRHATHIVETSRRRGPQVRAGLVGATGRLFARGRRA